MTGTSTGIGLEWAGIKACDTAWDALPGFASGYPPRLRVRFVDSSQRPHEKLIALEQIYHQLLRS